MSRDCWYPTSLLTSLSVLMENPLVGLKGVCASTPTVTHLANCEMFVILFAMFISDI